MMNSLARFHYPYLVYRDEQKKLWDPIHSKTLKVRPEERVRQRLLNCFIHESICPKSRISTETPVQLSRAETVRRSDILCYDKSFNPSLLVECKSEQVPLSEEAATQIARYNREIGAPLILLSNGHTDRWFDVSSDQVQALEAPPAPYRIETSRTKTAAYWVDRGFIGSRSPDELRQTLGRLLNLYWIEAEKQEPSVTFLSFSQHPDHLLLDHYYHVQQVQDSPRVRIALAFMASRDQDSHLSCVINREKENIGFIDINFNLLFDRIEKNMHVYTTGHIHSFDAQRQLSLQAREMTQETFKQLPDRLYHWFESIENHS